MIMKQKKNSNHELHRVFYHYLHEREKKKDNRIELLIFISQMSVITFIVLSIALKEKIIPTNTIIVNTIKTIFIYIFSLFFLFIPVILLTHVHSSAMASEFSLESLQVSTPTYTDTGVSFSLNHDINKYLTLLLQHNDLKKISYNSSNELENGADNTVKETKLMSLGGIVKINKSISVISVEHIKLDNDMIKKIHSLNTDYDLGENRHLFLGLSLKDTPGQVFQKLWTLGYIRPVHPNASASLQLYYSPTNPGGAAKSLLFSLNMENAKGQQARIGGSLEKNPVSLYPSWFLTFKHPLSRSHGIQIKYVDGKDSLYKELGAGLYFRF
jgi:hypothetical protein